MGENVKKFFEAVKGSKELQEKFKDVKDINGIIVIAKAAGYEITAEEIEVIAKAKKGELKDDDLESVAGGVCLVLSLSDLSKVKFFDMCVG